EPSMVAEDDETSKDKKIDKLMALISLSFKKIYNPTNNNLQTSSNTSRANQDNSPRINRNAGIGNVAGARETVGSTVVHKYGIQCYNCKEFGHVARECQKPKKAKDAAYHREKMLLLVHKSGIQCYNCKEFGHVARECQKPKKAKDTAYHREKMLLCKQEDARIQLNTEQADWIDDTDDDELKDQELEVSNDDHYNVFAIESAHPKQSESIHDIYPIEQDAQIVIIDSLDMNYDREELDQNDDDNDLAKERELLASLIEKLKCEIDENKNRNKFLETSNKVLIEKLKDNLLYADYKKSEAELERRNSREYASQMEIECAK
nr:hypothetical protein [Tanacetum cinerariifolium]